jgi:hypothetical protein
MPAELRHQLSISIARKIGGSIENTVNGPVVDVVQEPAPVLRAPLSGSAWSPSTHFPTTTIAARS